MWSASPTMLRANHELRTDGPYAITRHPIYTDLLGMLLGTVLLNGLGVSLALLVVGAAVLVTRIPIEERLMSKTFPDEYARYRERVPRLVPSLRPLRRSPERRRLALEFNAASCPAGVCATHPRPTVRRP